MAVKRTVYQRKVDVDMLNSIKSVLADVSSVSPSSEQRQPYVDGKHAKRHVNIAAYRMTLSSTTCHVWNTLAISSPTTESF